MKFSLARMIDIKQLVKELENGLRKLTFAENFQSSIVTLNIRAGEEKSVPHGLQVVPSYYILGEQSATGQLISDKSKWNQETITIENTGTNNISATLVIMR